MSNYYSYLTSIRLMNFGTHEKAKFWNYSLNAKGPSEYALNSHKKFYFNCNDCGHLFNSSLLNINQNDTWCPYCNHKKLCDDIKCKLCEEKSFMLNPRAIYWSIKNILHLCTFKTPTF